MISQKIIFRVFINTIIGVILIFIWLQFVNISQITAVLKTVKFKYILLFFIFFIISTILRSLRLKLILRDFKISFLTFFSLISLGQFLSFLIPIRAGEIAKGGYLSSHYQIPFGKILVWIFLDRFFDFWVIVFLTAVFLNIVPTKLSDSVALLAVVILIVFSIAAYLAIFYSHKAVQFAPWFAKLIPIKKIRQLFLSFSLTIIDGFKVLKRGKLELFYLFFVSFLALLSDSMIWYFVFLSIESNIGILKAVLATQLSALTFLIPSAPGYVGSLEASGLAVFNLALEIPANTASAALVLFHILSIIILLIVGIGSIYFLKFDFKVLTKRLRK